VKISVVIPFIDEAAALPGTLARVSRAASRWPAAEIIAVDGGSADGSGSVVARFPGVRLLHAPRGRAAQMNAGAAAATGDALVFLHADTRLPEDAAALIENALRRGSRWGRFDVTIEGRSRLLPLVAAAMNLRSRLTGIATGDQALFVARDAFAAVGGFPPLPLMEDIAISRALKRAAGPPACLRARVTTSGRRWDEHGALRTIVAMWRLRFDHWRGIDPAVLAQRYRRSPRRAPPALHVFAKDPVPGRVKTRLAAQVGDDAAALVYRELAERTLATAVASRAAGVVGEVVLWCDPDPVLPAFDAWGRRFGVTLCAQGPGDLGRRMHAALRASLDHGRAALLIGTDAPAIDVAYLARAAAALGDHDVVLGPADDGGYVLVGLARDADIFSGIRWGGDDVMAATRARVARAGLAAYEMPASWDVDTAADLARYRALPPAVTAAPHRA
jgi:rSAM/selenodomain-associated transferase 2/rSAM/selenodomain-associated transferase 1